MEKRKCTSNHNELLETVNEKESYYCTLKKDAVEDVKSLFLLERKMKFIDAEFEMRDEQDSNLKGTKLEGKVPS